MRRRSCADMSEIREIFRPGSSVIDCRSIMKCRAICSIVAASNKSASYSSQPWIRSSSVINSSTRSCCATLGSSSTKRTRARGNAGARRGVFCNLNITGRSVFWLALRASWRGFRASSMGRSWFCKASSVTCRDSPKHLDKNLGHLQGRFAELQCWQAPPLGAQHPHASDSTLASLPQCPHVGCSEREGTGTPQRKP